MTKVITYGTYDLLHRGHVRLLERAKALGDYLIVGVTSDDYDKTRGKINNQQTLMERIASVKALGLADEIIVEEYEGQKIDDIRKYGIDIFTVGSDWEGKFDYLNDYCKVVYLSRTEGVSSTEIRTEKNKVRIGLWGEPNSKLTSISKFMREVPFVNGMEVVCSNAVVSDVPVCTDYFQMLDSVDAVYITSNPSKHYRDCKVALEKGKHVLCESPVALSSSECNELYSLAEKNHCILMDGLKTAYMTAFERLVLLAKTGKIGSIVSVDATCTSLKTIEDITSEDWNSITEWGPVALLPVFQILGTNYKDSRIVSKLSSDSKFDLFTKVSFEYENAVASIKVAKGAKSEGDLVISGTKGYIYVPAPWWKTDYFEVRYENPSENKRYFYQLEGEGIRYEIVSFVKAIENGKSLSSVDKNISLSISEIMENYFHGKVFVVR